MRIDKHTVELAIVAELERQAQSDTYGTPYVWHMRNRNEYGIDGCIDIGRLADAVVASIAGQK